MVGISIVLLLTCGVIVIQAGRFSNHNSNLNSNVLNRRNYNANSNSNILGGGPRFSPYNDDDTDSEPKTSLDEIRDKLYAEGNGDAAEAVSAAAEATISITKPLAQEMSETSAIAVADAVARILTDRGSSGARHNRRNGNFNTNTNMNIVGRENSRPEKFDDRDSIVDEERDRISSEDLLKLEESLGSILGLGSSGLKKNGKDLRTFGSSYGLAHGSGATAFGYSPDFIGIAPARKNADILDDDVGDDNDDDDENSYFDEDTAIKTPSRRGSERANHRNTNLNSNMNYLPNGHRRNINSNVNNNSFRRNNVNSNANTNRIGHRYRRD